MTSFDGTLGPKAEATQTPDSSETTPNEEALRQAAAKKMLSLCLRAHSELPNSSVFEGPNGSSTVETFVISRMQALALSCLPVLLSTTTPDIGGTEEPQVVTKVHIGDAISSDPTIVLTMQRDGTVDPLYEGQIAAAKQLSGYSALIELMLPGG